MLATTGLYFAKVRCWCPEANQRLGGWFKGWNNPCSENQNPRHFRVTRRFQTLSHFDN